MFTYNIIVSVLVFCFIGISYGTVCNDCVVLHSCPGAVQLAISHIGNLDEVTISKFKASFCGYEYLELKSVVKVCCSDFTDSAENFETTAAMDAIETHPNVKLLPKSCGYIDGRRIIGNIAKLYEFPWMALISSTTGHGLDFTCSGTIVNSKYILTAGHCVSDNKILGVRIGEHDIQNKVDCQGEEDPYLVCESHIQDIRVENIILHPNFTGLPDLRNDVALIRLKKAIDLELKNAFPICLPVTQKLRNVPLADRRGTLAGWDLTDSSSRILSKIYISVKTDDECRSLLKNSSDEGERILKEICAVEYQRDTCIGDSGSPLMVEGLYEGGDRFIQYGILSRRSTECGSEPGVYTDVTKFMEWVLDNMRE